MPCEHKNVSVRIVTVQSRGYEKDPEFGYLETYTEDDELDWETATIQCDDCGKMLTSEDLWS